MQCGVCGAKTSEQAEARARIQGQFDALLDDVDVLSSGAGKVVLTMHDLPQWPHWRSPSSKSAKQITTEIVAALEKHGLKGVYNFTNSGTGLVANDDATVLPYDPALVTCVDCWVEAGQHVANHTHSHAAIFQVKKHDLKGDILRADAELAPWMSKAPTKLFCFCIDCQGDTDEEAREAATFVRSLGYRQLLASSMVFEWEWEMAYLGMKADGNEASAAQLRSDFIAYSVRQTVLDCKRSYLLEGEDFIPTLLLHMLNIVADSLDDWLAAHKAAGCVFVAAEETLPHAFWKHIEGIADPVHEARPAMAKVANRRGFTWQECCHADAERMRTMRELGEVAVKAGHLQFTNHLGDRELNHAQ